MSDQSYKILAAKRLAIDPAAIIWYIESNDHVLVTTPDGKQHFFSFAELRHPAKKTEKALASETINLAEKAEKGPGSANMAPAAAPQPAKRVARSASQRRKPKSPWPVKQ